MKEIAEFYGISAQRVEQIVNSDAYNFRRGRSRRDRTRIVYFIGCGEYVKIGVALDVDKRMRQLEATIPFPITLLGVTMGGQENEAQLHVRFAHLRHKGEWFRFEGELRDYISTL